MSICLPFLLYVCGFFSKDHAYTSIEDSMAIGDPKVCGDIFQYHWVKVQLAFTTEKHQSKPILICSMFLLASRFSPSTFLHIHTTNFFQLRKKPV